MNKSELIDDQYSTIKIDLTYSNGPSFSTATQILGVILIILGVAALISGGGGYIIGTFIILASIFALTSYSGTDISIEHNLIREYSKSFGFKFGKWKSTSIYPFISIIGNNKNQLYTNFLTGGYVASQQLIPVQQTKIESNSIEVVLLSATHLKRVMIVKCKKLEQAFQIAKEISEVMNKEMVKFNPQISESSKRKR